MAEGKAAASLRSETLCEELARRAGAIAHAAARGRESLELPEQLTRRIEAAERRARSLTRAGGESEESRRAAAVDFIAGAATMLILDAGIAAGDVRDLVADAAVTMGISQDAASLIVFQRALTSSQAAELPPLRAYRFVLELIVELGLADAVSLWVCPTPGQLECVASAGEAATSRRLRVAARALLRGEVALVSDDATHIRSVVIERWDRPHAALIARGRPEASGRLAAYLAEAATALSPLFERERLFEHNAERERALVSASERALTRLGCDLHDGPLQNVVALADELRRVRAQVSAVLDADLAARVGGCFDDLEARLVGLDQGLRDIAHAVRFTSAVERPLEDALRSEVDALSRTATLEASLAIDGDLSEMTASQKIVLFRVVQESLSNARRHSRATRVHVRVRSSRRHISVTVADDGCGFDVAAAKRSGRLGLTGVIERVRLLGGEVEIESAPGHGTTVRANVPRWSRVGHEVPSLYAVTA